MKRVELKAIESAASLRSRRQENARSAAIERANELAMSQAAGHV